MSEAIPSNFSGAVVPPIGPSARPSVVPQADLAARPPSIHRLPAGLSRPFWSVMIPVYNCHEDYFRETLQSVLRQDPGIEEMQIEVIDNCSTIGDPEAIVREIGAGRVDFHRQPENVGAGENFVTCIKRARGQWVHILHADDTVKPDFYDRTRRGVLAHPEAGAALCRTIYMDEGAQLISLSELEALTPGVLADDFVMRLLVEQRIQFVSIVVRRSTYEELGGFRSFLAHCLDWDMWKRIAVAKPIYYDPEPMACFRMHAASDSSGLMRTGENVRCERQSIEYSCADLPRDYALRVRRAALKAAGVGAARRARQLWKHGQRAAAWRQLGEGMRCSLAPAVLARSAYFLLRTIVR